MWGKYATDLKEFLSMEKRESAVACLNDLVTNALSHVPDVIKYMSRLKNQSVFNFCAIPQVRVVQKPIVSHVGDESAVCKYQHCVWSYVRSWLSRR